jgi:hypothetical protein
VDDSYSQLAESNKKEIGTPYRLLKGMNAKSTDSLSISVITNLKGEKERTDYSKQPTEVTEITEFKKQNLKFSSMETMNQTNTKLR